MKRNLYILQFDKNSKGEIMNKECVTVIRTDQNFGTQGYVYKDGSVKRVYTPRQIPQYIVKQCVAMIDVLTKTTIPPDYWGVHKNHCSIKEGCKYGDSDCPVVLGLK